MDFNDTPEEAKFRKEAYEWLKANAELKDGPKDGWRASSEEEGLKEDLLQLKELYGVKKFPNSKYRADILKLGKVWPALS